MPVIDLGSVIGPQGVQGAAGQRGPQGIQGNPGPNQVTGSTSTTLSGILQGDGSRISTKQLDSVPTADSANLVTSGGIFNALSEKSGDNFIANWYFYGGGGGRGIMPVNQRGKSSYDGGSMTIDGWVANSRCTVRLGSTYMRLTADSEGTAYLRYFTRECPAGWITFSALVRGTGTGQIGVQGYANNTITPIADTSARATISEPGSSWTLVSGSYQASYSDAVRIFAMSVTTGTSLEFLAVKLERGKTQTLAHREGNSWVLNDTPDYDLALLHGQLNSGYANESLANHIIATAEMFGPVEVGTTASRAYTTGKIFVWKGLLYKAKTSISSGATLTEGTNCEQTTLAALLNLA